MYICEQFLKIYISSVGTKRDTDGVGKEERIDRRTNTLLVCISNGIC